MAATQVVIDNPAGLTNYSNTALGGTVSAVKASSGVIHAIVVDNALNGAATYLKMWDVASGSVTIGTTSPDFVWKIPASVKRTFSFPEGFAFGTALTVAATTTGLLAGVTDPSSNFPINISYT